MKTAFIINGFRMNTSAEDERFRKLREAVAGKGYKVIPVPFYWNNVTVLEYVEKFMEFYKQHKGTHNTVIGNSYGAMVAFLAAPIIKPDKVLICSLSPYFKEDLPKHDEKYMLRRFGKRRTAQMSLISADETARALNETKVETIFLRGSVKTGVDILS